MKISSSWKQRQIAGCLVIFLAVPFAEAAGRRPLPVPPGQPTQSSAAAPTGSSDSGTSNANTTMSQPAATSIRSTSSSSNDVDQEHHASVALPSVPQQQENNNSNPVGTAAAPYQKATGIAASRPAGAVVAPAKQKRSRSFLIRVGLIVGACVAVGTVVALSAGSPSRP